MRKFILMALAGIALALAVPEFASAAPFGGGLGAAADNSGITQDVRHRRWHRGHRHRHCTHRRYTSGRRC